MYRLASFEFQRYLGSEGWVDKPVSRDLATIQNVLKLTGRRVERQFCFSLGVSQTLALMDLLCVVNTACDYAFL